MSESSLPYAEPGVEAAAPRRGLVTWVQLLLVWAVGLAVWAVYIALLAWAFFFVFG